ncbi:MAG: MotA/TolQ/ExbB proton channel family protein [Puniceicoccales bacterium]|jgi:biopolymer transport protein ExbB|nr:MotA/TolQ/ExbB proton channel family protein [Puniceicoccales bacterium]
MQNLTKILKGSGQYRWLEAKNFSIAKSYRQRRVSAVKMTVSWALRFSQHLTNTLLPLLLVLGIALALERLLFFHKTRVRPEFLLCGLKNLLSAGRLREAIILCERAPGPLARILKGILLAKVQVEPCLDSRYSVQIDVESRILERNMASIAMLAKLLPLLGCFGTALALLESLAQVGQCAMYPAAALFAPMFMQSFSAAILGLSGGIILQLAYHFLHARLLICIRDFRVGVDELHHVCAAIGGKEAPPCREPIARF